MERDAHFSSLNSSKSYEKYKTIPNEKTVMCGRLAQYKYFDMDDTIETAFKLIESL